MTPNVKALIGEAMASGLRPPPRLTLSEWADTYFYLSAENSAQAGKWTTLPYQREMMDAITDPTVTQVSVIKSARVGYTLCISAAIGYYIHQAPASILCVQPTVEDAKGYSKETIGPMLRDNEVLSAIVHDETTDERSSTIQLKAYPGGVLSVVGANSGSGFRRVSRKIILFDEVDAYPASAGADGDPVDLGKKRAAYFWDRKYVLGSTPLVAGRSRIEVSFKEGDQRRFYVPCPHCGHSDYLVFTQRMGRGHHLQWPDEKPEEAFFVCAQNGCVIEHKDKRSMVSAGKWVAHAPFTGHASFHIWAAYSFSPTAEWGQLAKEFLDAKRRGPDALRVFCNTVLGETWQEAGDAPEWERLYERREHYAVGSVPDGVKFLTCGLDVQKDRVVYEVVGWGANRESWSVDVGVIPFDTSNDTEWKHVDKLLAQQYQSALGPMAIQMLAVDSGYNTQIVYNWGRRHERSRVIAVKGVHTARSLISTPTPVDVAFRGQKIARGFRVWPLGVDMAKSELYGWLRLKSPIDGQPYPPGYCHFPEHGPDYFKQLTAEHLVSSVKKNGYTVHEWQLIKGRENHFLDARIYARAAAAVLGMDRMPVAKPPPVAPNFEVAKLGREPPQPQPVAPDSRLRRKYARGNKPWL